MKKFRHLRLLELTVLTVYGVSLSVSLSLCLSLSISLPISLSFCLFASVCLPLPLCVCLCLRLYLPICQSCLSVFFSNPKFPDFGFNCTNSTIVGDRCVDVVTNGMCFASLSIWKFTADTVINAASACSKKGFRLYVSHDDSDIQQLLGTLSTTYRQPNFQDISHNLPSQLSGSDLELLPQRGLSMTVVLSTFSDGRQLEVNKQVFDCKSNVVVFSTVSQGGQFLSKPTDNVNIGYIDVQKSTVKWVQR